MKLVREILTGKVILMDFWGRFNPHIILGVRENTDKYCPSRYDILLGSFQYNPKRPGFWKSGSLVITEENWVPYHTRNKWIFYKRSNKETTRNCVKTNPDKLHHHIGITIKPYRFLVYPSKFSPSDNYYKKYLKLIS